MEKYYDPRYGTSAKKKTFRNELEINDIENELFKLEEIYKEISEELREDVYEQ